MVPYGVLALALAVTAKVREKGIRDGKWFKLRPWLMLLLHAPVLSAWLHVCFFLSIQLVVANVPWNTFEYAHLVIHALVLLMVGLVSIFTYRLQLHQWRSDSTELEQG